MTEWRCSRCWKVASGKHNHCPQCGGRWDRVQDLTFTPQNRPTKSPKQDRAVYAATWDWQDQGAYAQHRGRSASVRSQPKPRRRPKKKKNASEEVPFYAAPSMPAPWKSDQETIKSTEKETAAAANISAEMVRDFREAFPNPATMPPEVRRIVEKYDAQTGKNLTAAMLSTSTQIGDSRDTLRKLQDARIKHRSSWLQHMKSLMETLGKQVEAYEKQQKDYDERITTTRRAIQGARRELQRLNAQAATDQKKDIQPSIEEDENQEQTIDLEEDDLRTQVQDLLSKCLRKTDVAIDIPSEEEEAMDDSAERLAKRPRSVDQSSCAGK